MSSFQTEPSTTTLFTRCSRNAPKKCETRSYILTENPAGVEPNESPDTVRTTDHCKLQGVAPAWGLGEWYLSIKARDNAGRWSNDYITFGPFEVLDCNNTGQLGICDISCDHTGTHGTGLGICRFDISPCLALEECVESSKDCNNNLRPDECDINEGFSEDCDVNFVPDDCQEMKHWISAPIVSDRLNWGLNGNWEEKAIPQNGDSVCISDRTNSVPVVQYSEDDTHLTSLACRRDFSLGASAFPWPDLELDENSFVLGFLSMSGTSTTLTVNDRLYVDSTSHLV